MVLELMRVCSLCKTEPVSARAIAAHLLNPSESDRTPPASLWGATLGPFTLRFLPQSYPFSLSLRLSLRHPFILALQDLHIKRAKNRFLQAAVPLCCCEWLWMWNGVEFACSQCLRSLVSSCPVHCVLCISFILSSPPHLSLCCFHNHHFPSLSRLQTHWAGKAPFHFCIAFRVLTLEVLC